MSLFTPEQLIASHKANTAALFTLTNQAFDGFSKLVELNIQAVRSALTERATYWREALSCKTPEEFLAWRTNLMQPASEQALSYSRQLADIGSSAYAGWVNAVRVQYEQHIITAQTLVDNLAKDAPAGSEVATTMLKSAFLTFSHACDIARRAVEQPTEPQNALHNRLGQSPVDYVVNKDDSTVEVNSALATAGSAGETVREAARRVIETAKGGRTTKR
jgi:phasin family protein